MVDISFLLPTLRKWPQYGQRVVDSIYQAARHTSYNYEILVSSPFEVKGERITWYGEKQQLGALSAFNHLAHQAIGRYIMMCVDDHICDDNLFSVVGYLDGPEFSNRRYKLVTIASGGRCPIPNHPPFNTDTDKNQLLYSWTTARFPVLSTKTWREDFGGYVFQPRFWNSHADIYLGYYLGINGEPIIEYEGTRLREFDHVHNASRESDLHDEKVCVELMNSVKAGDRYA